MRRANGERVRAGDPETKNGSEQSEPTPANAAGQREAFLLFLNQDLLAVCRPDVLR